MEDQILNYATVYVELRRRAYGRRDPTAGVEVFCPHCLAGAGSPCHAPGGQIRVAHDRRLSSAARHIARASEDEWIARHPEWVAAHPMPESPEIDLAVELGLESDGDEGTP